MPPGLKSQVNKNILAGTIFQGLGILPGTGQGLSLSLQCADWVCWLYLLLHSDNHEESWTEGDHRWP